MTENPTLYVIDPGVLLRELRSPGNSHILTMWKNGDIQPVTSRPILEHSLKLLVAAGIPAEVVNIWALWLSHPDKSRSFKADPEKCPAADYIQACLKGPAKAIITDHPERYTALNKLVKTVAPADIA